MSLSPQRREEIVDALRRGTVPRNSLDTFAVGLDRFESVLDEELEKVRRGGSLFKAIRGDYGCGKTFLVRWLADRARKINFATSEVQISDTETPLHRLETVYRRLMERLATADTPQGALKSIIDGWFFALEEDVLAEGIVDPHDQETLAKQTGELLEQRLDKLKNSAPAFSAALRGYREAQSKGDRAVGDGIIAWLGGQPNVAAAAKRGAGIKGDLDHYGSLSFLQGLLIVLADSGHSGLVLILDEVETIQRIRSDARDRSLNALRQLVDEIDAGRFPGLYLVITGTPAFYDGPQGIHRLEPLAQRLHTDFQTEARFDNPRAVQIRLSPFNIERLCAVGVKVRDIYAGSASSPERIKSLCGDDYIRELATAVCGRLGGKVGIAPRLFLKKLVGDILDRIDQFDDFDPRKNYALTIAESEMTSIERQATAAQGVDDIELNL